MCREVDLGPFKHKIDDGLELRKAAFECMDVLLERCRDQISMADFITHLEKGLQVSHFASTCLRSPMHFRPMSTANVDTQESSD